jgi:enoyl-CoA hydratase
MQRSGDRLHLALNRPARRNAFSAAMRDALVEGLLLAEQDASIAEVILSGVGPAFCSGGDLDEFGSRPDPATAHAVRSSRSASALMARCAKRVRAELHGACVGAGIELPAFASRVVAKEGAFFQLPELALGLVPGAGGTVSLPRRIGRERTAWLALSGERIDAATARRWGLIDEIRP